MSKEKQPSKARKVRVFGIIALAAGLIATGVYVGVLNGNRPSGEDPGFATLTPRSKPAADFGGWKRVSPPSADPVYAYSDVIEGVPVLVSQQAMPASFSGNINDKVTELAKQFNAAAEIDANGIIIYIGTSSKGPQSVIFTKNDLLILIKSQKQVKDSSWAEYVKSLS